MAGDTAHAAQSALEGVGSHVPRRGRPARRKGDPALCQVPGCTTPDLNALGTKKTHVRYRCCSSCMKSTEVCALRALGSAPGTALPVAVTEPQLAIQVYFEGVAKRFCQQCGSFHELALFTGLLHSCTKQLEAHNRRRRDKKALKAAAQAQGCPGGGPAAANALDEEA